MPFWIDVIYDVLEIALPLAMVPMAARVHRPYVALAWILFVVLMPVIGFAAYLYLSAYRGRRLHHRHREARERIAAALARPESVAEDEHASWGALARVVHDVGTPFSAGRPAVGGNRLELVSDSRQWIERLLEDLGHAREHAHLLFYQYNDDDTGRRVADALLAAVERGVRCRLLVGAFASRFEGTRSVFRELGPRLEEAGVEVVSLRPLGPLRGLRRADLRNHRKLAVIDGRVGHTGSQNIHDADLHLERGEWQQLMLRLEGPAALQLQAVFAEDWLIETGELLDAKEIFPEPEAADGAAAQILWWGPTDLDPAFGPVLLAILGGSRHHVSLTSPYFVPDEPLSMALQAAARRGVEVDLIVPERSDRRVADAAARANFGPLLRAGVRIHLHQDGFLHAKSLTADGELAMVGSANLDRRSLHLDDEVAALVYEPEVAAGLERVHTRYREASRRLHPERFAERSAWSETADRVANLLGPLL